MSTTRKTRVAKGRPKAAVASGTSELGASGLLVSGGVVREELLTTLQGSRGKKVLREMSENDAIVGAFLFAVEQMIRQVTWKVVPTVETTPAKTPDAAVTTPQAGQSPEPTAKATAGVPTVGTGPAADAQWVDDCREDMTESWSETITEILSMLVFGHQVSEIVYKKRNGPTNDDLTTSRFTDGRIGWRSLATRAQETLMKWEFEPGTNRVLGVYQQLPGGAEIYIPKNKYLLFRTKVRKGNPEGYSILRNAYRSWYFKKRFEEIEGIGVERDLAGLPTLTAPEGLDLWNTNDSVATAQRQVAETLIRSIRRDEQEGVLLPFGWDLKLLSTTGARSVATNDIINRYDQRIAMTVLADFILLGHSGKFGSFALSKTKTSAFVMSLYGYLNMIRDVFNRYAIPRLFEINGLPTDVLPRLDYGDVDAPNLRELGAFVRDVTGSSYVMQTPLLLRALLQAAGLPSDPTDIAKRMPETPADLDEFASELVDRIRRSREESDIDDDEDPRLIT